MDYRCPIKREKLRAAIGRAGLEAIGTVATDDCARLADAVWRSPATSMHYAGDDFSDGNCAQRSTKSRQLGLSGHAAPFPASSHHVRNFFRNRRLVLPIQRKHNERLQNAQDWSGYCWDNRGGLGIRWAGWSNYDEADVVNQGPT